MQNNTPSSSASIPVSSTPSAVGNLTQNSEMWLSLQESGFHGSKHSEQRKDVPFSKSSFNPTDKSSKLPRRQLSALRHDCVFTFTNGGSQPLWGSYFRKISFSPRPAIHFVQALDTLPLPPGTHSKVAVFKFPPCPGSRVHWRWPG